LTLRHPVDANGAGRDLTLRALTDPGERCLSAITAIAGS
jgi:hypothetical protein